MDPTVDPTTAVLSIVELGNRVEQRLDAALGHIKGVSLSEFRLLRAISESPSGSVSRVDLASLVHLSPSGVTRALKPLEKLGFVETARDARDARQAKAGLTKAGTELVSDAAGVLADAVAALLLASGTKPSDVEAARATLASMLG